MEPSLNPHVTHDRARDGDDEPNGKTFLGDMLKRAKIPGKLFTYKMRISRTTAQKWFRGELDDPIERSKIICALIFETSPHLLPVILLYIAGDKFDGLILDPVKYEALRTLSKALKQEAQP